MTKAELSRLYWLNKEIQAQQQRLAQLIAASRSTVGAISGLPHAGGIADKTALAAEIADCKAVIEAKLNASIAEYNRLTKYIGEIDDPMLRVIFRLRYIDGKSWQQIAFAIDECDEQYPRRKHNAYLKLDEKDE